MRLIAAVLFLSAGAAARANDFADFFRPVARASASSPRRTTEDPELTPSSGNLDRDTDAMWTRGYALLGYSAFSGARQSPGAALRFARRIGARYVVISSAPAKPRPDVLLIPSQPGTPMALAPQRFEQTALFFGPLAHRGVGLLLERPPEVGGTGSPPEREVFVRAVRQGSPADVSGLQPADIILTINGEPADQQALLSSTRSDAGQVEITFLRAQARRTVTITIAPDRR